MFKEQEGKEFSFVSDSMQGRKVHCYKAATRRWEAWMESEEASEPPGAPTNVPLTEQRSRVNLVAALKPIWTATHLIIYTRSAFSRGTPERAR